MPIEIRPTAVICSIRLVRFSAERKRSFWNWKIDPDHGQAEDHPQRGEVALDEAAQGLRGARELALVGRAGGRALASLMPFLLLRAVVLAVARRCR